MVAEAAAAVIPAAVVVVTLRAEATVDLRSVQVAVRAAGCM